jgi:hypothetical protein
MPVDFTGIIIARGLFPPAYRTEDVVSRVGTGGLDG